MDGAGVRSPHGELPAQTDLLNLRQNLKGNFRVLGLDGRVPPYAGYWAPSFFINPYFIDRKTEAQRNKLNPPTSWEVGEP